MIIITDYYRFAKPENTKSKTRFDLIASYTSGNGVGIIENSKDVKGTIKIYYSDVPSNYKADKKRQATKIITSAKGKSITSVFVPNIENNLFGYGDIKNTNDLLLFLFNSDYTEIEIFICKNRLNDKNAIFNLFTDNELFNEIDFYRKNAKYKNAI